MGQYRRSDHIFNVTVVDTACDSGETVRILIGHVEPWGWQWTARLSDIHGGTFLGHPVATQDEAIERLVLWWDRKVTAECDSYA